MIIIIICYVRITHSSGSEQQMQPEICINLKEGNMNAMLIGADRLGNIPKLLSDWDINITQHVNGRHVSHQRKPQGLPKNTELLILFTDFLGHNVMRHFRNMAQTRGVPFIACRRSASCLAQSLEHCFNRKVDLSKCQNCPFRP